MVVKPESLLAHTDFVRALARRLVLDEHRAEDVAQETWLAALEKPPRAVGAVRSWLASVTRNFARLAMRGESRRAARERVAARPEGAPSAEEIVEWEGVRRRVVEAVLGLELPYRDVILCRFYEELPPRDIAKRLGLPVETVKTRLKRGLKQLRARLDGELGAGDGRSWCLALLPVAGWKLGVLGLGRLGAVSGVSDGAGAGVSAGGVAVSGAGAGAAAGGAAGGVAAATSIGASLSLPGVIAMSLKVKIGVAAVVILAGAAAVWVLVGPDNHGPSHERVDASGIAGGLVGEDGARDADGSSSTAGAESLRRQAGGSDVEMQRVVGSGVPVCGRVLDQEGKAIEGVIIDETRVEVFYDRSLPEDALWSDTGRVSEPDGRFQVMVPLNQIPLTYLQFRHPDYRIVSKPLAAAVADYEHRFFLEDVRLDPAYGILGQVVDFRGRPVQACTVTAPGTPWEKYKSSIHDLAHTDADGRFRLSVRRKEATRVTAYLEKMGHGWSLPVIPGVGKETPEVKITLRKSASISGRLLNADGSPAAGKHLFAVSKVEGYEIRRKAMADEKGTFLFTCLPEALYRIEIELVGIPDNLGHYRDARHRTLVDGIAIGTSDLLFHLSPGSKLALHLEDRDGNPIDIEPEVDFCQYVYRTEELKRIRTNATHCGFDWSGIVGKAGPGTYIYDNIQPGLFYLDIDVEGYSGCFQKGVVVPAPPGTADLTVTLQPSRAISGRVFSPDGGPARSVVVEDAWVDRGIEEYRASFTHEGVRRRAKTKPGKRVVTDENGGFRLEGVRFGEHHLIFSVMGREVHAETGVKVTNEEPHAEVKVTLPPTSGSVEGIVRDANRMPRANACVVAWDGDRLFNMTRSDEAGRYAFFNMADGRYIVDARVVRTASTWHESGGGWNQIRKGFGNLETLGAFNALIEEGRAYRLDLSILDPWNSVVKGRIDSGSRPLPDSLHAYLSEVEEGERNIEAERPTMADLFHYTGFSGNDRDYRVDHFRFEDLRAGKYQVRVDWFGYGDSKKRPERWIESEVIELKASSVHTIDIHLGLATLKGQVVDKTTREPVSGAKLHLFKDNNQHHLGLDGQEDGSFKMESIPAGEYTLVVQHPSYRPWIKTDLTVLENVDIVSLLCELEPGCSVEGFVKLKEGSWRLYGWHVWPVIPPLGQYTKAGGRVLEDGNFSIKGLPPGTIKFLLKDGSDTVDEKTYTLPLSPGERIEFEAPEEKKTQEDKDNQ